MADIDIVTKTSVFAKHNAFRKSRDGEENDLVESFLYQIKDLKYPKGCAITVFREPYIASGVPDMVMVVWKPQVTQSWNTTRAELNAQDMRIIHSIQSVGQIEESFMLSTFGKSVLTSLSKLEECNMVVRQKNCWRSRPLSKIFAASHIIAIEAKIKEHKKVVQQAYLNTWFASASMILVPKITNSVVSEAANSLGLGVIEQGNFEVFFDNLKINKSVNRPASYASWLFNDWAWRAKYL